VKRLINRLFNCFNWVCNLSETQKKKRTTRPIPHHTLEEALKVAFAIQIGNNGKPWKPVFIADYMKIKVTTQEFRDYTSSAYRYGLTKGTANAKTIALTPLGQTLTKATSKVVEMAAKQTASQNIPIYKKIYEHYKEGRLPSKEDKFFHNLLESEFGVASEFINDCVDQLVANGLFAGILFYSQGSYHVTYTAPSIASEPSVDATESDTTEVGTYGESVTSVKLIDTPSREEKQEKPNQIFVVHGKNRTPMKQLKTILDKFKIPYKVALDEPHKGRPISKKVADLMHECTSAIIIFTADEMLLDSDGNEVWRPSDNAVYELGAASILYDKIVILKEKGVSLASDFSDIGYIPFEKDQLEAKAMELLTEFIGFGFVQITPT